MKKTRIALPLWSILLVWAASLAPTGHSQGTPAAPSENPGTVRVALGSASGSPGGSVVVPVYFTPSQGAHVGHLKIRVTFVSANLKFDKLEKGIAAEIGNVALAHELRVESNERGVETSALTLEATPPNSVVEGIPPGLLAYIQLRLNPEARPATITLRTAFEATERGTGRPLEVVPSPDATVEVLAPGSEPAVVCFFFAH